MLEGPCPIRIHSAFVQSIPSSFSSSPAHGLHSHLLRCWFACNPRALPRPLCSLRRPFALARLLLGGCGFLRGFLRGLGRGGLGCGGLLRRRLLRRFLGRRLLGGLLALAFRGSRLRRLGSRLSSRGLSFRGRGLLAFCLWRGSLCRRGR